MKVHHLVFLGILLLMANSVAAVDDFHLAGISRSIPACDCCPL